MPKLVADQDYVPGLWAVWLSTLGKNKQFPPVLGSGPN